MQEGEMLSDSSIAECGFSYDPNQFNLLSYFSLCIALFSIYRLAKFNIDTRQSSGFIGLPTPANAIFISSFIFAYYFYTDQVSFFGEEGYTIYPPLSDRATVNFDPQLMLNWQTSSTVFKLIFNPYTALGISFVFSVLLVSEIPLFALKFKNFGWNDNKIRYLFLLLSLVMLILFQLIALPFIVILYIVISILNNLFKITV
jgi:CDP-diacylglycerol--serine O-phosphatidyltransferase